MIGGTPHALRGVGMIIGAYGLIHTVAWMFLRVLGNVPGSAEWWTPDALMLSAAIQARAAAIACAVGFGILWMFSRETRATRSQVQNWLGMMIVISVAILEAVLSKAGVEPTRPTAELVLGNGGHNGLIIGAIVLVSQWIRLTGDRWLQAEPQSPALGP